MKILGPDPLLFVDSVEWDMSQIHKIDPVNVSNIEILKPKTARKIFGIRGKDGVVNITTMEFARFNYWRFFTSKSKDYLQAVPTPQSDTSVVYILNDSILTKNPGGSLYFVNKKNFRKLFILTQPELSDKYGIKDKRLGVLVKIKKRKKRIV